MRITCPYCGDRDHQEFTYRGDATAIRPKISNGSIESHASFVFDRANPAGDHRELWNHTSGCRSHVMVTRNTLTHEISDCQAIGPWGKASKTSPVRRSAVPKKAGSRTSGATSTRSISAPAQANTKSKKAAVKPRGRSKK